MWWHQLQPALVRQSAPALEKTHVHNVSESAYSQCIHLTHSECMHCHFYETYSVHKAPHPSKFWTDLAASFVQLKRQTVNKIPITSWTSAQTKTCMSAWSHQDTRQTHISMRLNWKHEIVWNQTLITCKYNVLFFPSTVAVTAGDFICLKKWNEKTTSKYDHKQN